MGNVTSTGEYLLTTPTFEYILYTGTPPSCSIPQSACSSMQMAYNSAWSKYGVECSAYTSSIAANLTVTAPTIASTYSDNPHCNATGTSTTPVTGCGPCNLYGGSVQLLYFPPGTEVSRDMCATVPVTSTDCPFGNGQQLNNTNNIGQATAPCAFYSDSITLPPDTGPHTVSNGYTFYENKAYLAYQTAYASNDCGRVGSHYSAGILPVASEDLYSVLGYHFELSNAAYQVKFADFSTPVPYSAYYGQPQCDEGGNLGLLQWPNMLNGKIVEGLCGDPGYVVYDELYAPRLAVPPEFRSLDPAWSHCLLGLDGLFDPPKALQPASSAAGPTSPAVAITLSTTTASPAQTPSSPAATTAPPIATPKALSDMQGTSTVAQRQPGGSVSKPAPQSSEKPNDSPSSQTSSNAPVSDASGDGASTAFAQVNPADPGGVMVSAPTSSGRASSVGGVEEPGQPISADPGGAIVSAVNNGGPSSPTASSNSQPPNGPATSQTASLDTGSPVINTESSAFSIATTIDRQGNTVLVVTMGGSTATLSAGQTTVLGGQAVSAGQSGEAIVGSGSSATNLQAGNAGNSGLSPSDPDVVSVGSSAFAVMSTQAGSFSTIVVANGGSTLTLKPGETTTFRGQLVNTQASGGLNLGTGSSATTLQAGTADNPEIAPLNVAIVAGATISADPSDPSNVVVLRQTLTPGQVTTVAGTAILVASDGSMVLGSGQAASTVPIVQATRAALDNVTPNGHTSTHQQDPSNGQALIADGSSTGTFRGSGTAVLDDLTVSAGASGDSSYLVASQTVPLSADTVLASPLAIVTLGGEVVVVLGQGTSPSTVAVDGTTLSRGQTATIDGTLLSVAPTGLVVGGTQTIPFTVFQTSGLVSQAVVTLNGHILAATELSNGDAVIQGARLPQGSATTIDGVLVSNGASGLAVGSTQTVPFSAAPSATGTPGLQAAVTLGSHTFTASELSGGSSVVMDGTTLTQGGLAVTIAATVVSDGPNGLVIGGTQMVPQSYAPATGTSVGIQPAAATSTKTSGASDLFARSSLVVGIVVAFCVVAAHYL
ncbi:hypothetical protein LTR22_025763 [Elasticomyces elasticus]|nr:hypothetical protein LTR22_025763 [Elasticomyces elasticus]KAK4904387.1 hypothetical protein LTR49_026152 [Elasticomyces elasticus]